jgi:hypothetical protein
LVQRILIAVVHIPLLLLSAFCLWGWVTVSDIKIQAEKHGYDYNAVIAAMLGEPVETNALGGIGPNSRSPTPPPVSFLNRLRIGESLSLSRNLTNSLGQPVTESLEVKVSYLDPFFRISVNAVNVLFIFGIGYIMSSVLVWSAYLRNKPITVRFWVLRPIVGAMVSVCLYIIVLSGGRILWDGTAQPNSLSLGLIAVLGSLYGERFEKMLATSLSGNREAREPDGSAEA